MSLSFDEFRAGLLLAPRRQALGIALTDAQAQQVLADPQSSHAWYSYWLSIGAPGSAPDVATPPLIAAQVVPSPDGVAYAASAASHVGAVPPSLHSPRSHVGLWVTLSLLGAVFLVCVAVAMFASITARHWTKVDVAAVPETYHSEPYQTGLYEVSMDAVSPCWVDEDWTDCINSMTVQYQAACTGVGLTNSASSLCGVYRSAIAQMKASDQDGSYVDTVGAYGHLTQSAETAARVVSNNDAKPAVTHHAVCYLGFIGECR